LTSAPQRALQRHQENRRKYDERAILSNGPANKIAKTRLEVLSYKRKNGIFDNRLLKMHAASF
jgi:hypothetical protein